MKLKQREQQVLKAIQDGERALYMPFAGRFNPTPYYTMTGNIDKCTREIKKLIKLGLVVTTKKHEYNNNHSIELTEDGKNFKYEFDIPYDVWVVNSAWGILINKYLGILTGTTLVLDNGASYKENDKRKFFSNREAAFEHALSLQDLVIRRVKGKLVMETEALEKLEKRKDNPEEDAAGYL